ncbi:putative Glycine cleavage T protein (Aminomethyl transferase) [metagenome]|uniref:Putative Glycine cleavage T protein (Aminomethyl transferase) n=1 Tax=metagenome TaxID=256318 RepID=A0A2P2C9G9_9ZZZZ
MIRTTPFHPRLSELNTTGLYTHWAGHLSALRYTHAPKHEYFAVRNGVGVFDGSPLYKYWIRGRDAERLLAGVFVRDIRTCRPGRAHYTVWCDDRGFVMEDGVVFRHGDNEFFLTSARPQLGYLSDLARRLEVELIDVSDDFGILALQGPRSRAVLAALTDDTTSLRYFEHTETKVASTPITVSRTGYTGDLGYEIRVPSDRALDVLDALLEAGQPHGLRPFGEDALMMLRIEAGLPLVDVDFHNSRLVFTDHDRVTPTELGLGWMLRGLDDDRAFIGRDALRRERADRTSRWATVGLVVDWQHWDALYREAGLLPDKSEMPLGWESMLYDADGEQIGYATAFMYSPVLQRHIAMARVRPAFAAVDTEVDLEVTINHHNTKVLARTARLPLFNPERKTSTP